MKLNDPFGRMQARRQREYESLRQSLRDAGLTEPEEAQRLVETMRRRGRLGLAVVIPATLLLALAFPEARVVVIALGGIAALWWFNASRRGQDYVARYLHEELSGEKGGDDDRQDSPEDA